MNETVDLGKIYGFNQCSAEGCGQIMPNMSQNNNTLAEQPQAAEATQNPNRFMPTPQQQDFAQQQVRDNMLVSPQFNNAFPQNQQSNTSGMSTGQFTVPNTNVQIPFVYEQYPTLNGFIRTQIGRRVKADFLIGSNSLVTKDGYLVGVGSNYLLINEIGTKNIVAGDFYNLKFISFPY